jgi:regulator of sigma E protease
MIVLYVIIGLAVLILVHELGHFFAAKIFGIKVEEFGIGYPPKLFSKKYGETEYSINALPFGGFNRIYGEDKDSISEDDKDYKRSFSYQKPWKRSVVILSGVFMNVVLGWVLLSFVFMIGAPKHLSVASVMENSPAYETGIETNDIILEASFGETLITDPIDVENFISLINENKGKEIILKIKRGEDLLTKEMLVRENPPEGEGSLGIALFNMGIEKQGFFKSIGSAFTTTFRMLEQVVIGFYKLITGLFTNPDIVKSVSGPVGIFMITKQVGSVSLIYLVQFIALISLNLVVLNLLPFPALDGGRFLFILIEKIKGSPVSNKIQMGINAVGFIILIVLMILVTIKDFTSFIF